MKDNFNPETLVNLGGMSHYSEPEFVWNQTVGPTGLKFLHSEKLGISYQDDLFVSDFNNGFVYHFDLDTNRTSLVLTGELADKVANPKELHNAVFARGFIGITDLEMGPDGYLYIVALAEGKIYRIVPASLDDSIPPTQSTNDEIDGWFYIDTISGLLDEVLRQYGEKRYDEAKSLAIEAYADNFGLIMEDLAEDNEALMVKIEDDLSQVLIAMIDEKRPVAEVEEHIHDIQSNLEVSRAIVTPEFPIGSLIMMVMIMMLVAIIGAGRVRLRL
jgi:hypothetical protein